MRRKTIQLTDDIKEMEKLALTTEEGYHCTVFIFVPGTATVKELMAIRYWPKSNGDIEEYVQGTDLWQRLGYWFKVSVKRDYLHYLIKETIKAGGGFLDTDPDKL